MPGRSRYTARSDQPDSWQCHRECRIQAGNSASIGKSWRHAIQVLADDGSGFVLGKTGSPCQKVVGGRGEGVLIGPAIDVTADQLLWRRVGDGTNVMLV